MPGASEPGDIVHVDGRVLGRHSGILHFTIGQRRGLGVASGEPLYVIALEAEKARVVVGPREALATPTVKLRDFNWIGPGELSRLPAEGLAVAARVRSTRAPAPARLFRDGGVAFDEPESGVSPGQACVVYETTCPGARVFGGGFIVSGRKA